MAKNDFGAGLTITQRLCRLNTFPLVTYFGHNTNFGYDISQIVARDP